MRNTDLLTREDRLLFTEQKRARGDFWFKVFLCASAIFFLSHIFYLAI
jgi:hypothetical protein